MEYKQFKGIISRGIEMVKEGLSKEDLKVHFESSGVKVNDFLLNDFIEQAKVK